MSIRPRPGDARLKHKQLVAMAVVSGGLGLSAIGLGINMAHAVPTSPSPTPTLSSKAQVRPSKPPGPDIPYPLGPLFPDS
jgi:hypothetical protein